MRATAVDARRTPAGRSALRSSSALRSRTMHDRVLALQRTAGNRAVAQLARQPTAESDAPTLPRLTIPDLRLPLPAACVQDKTIQDAEPVKDDPESRKVTLTDGSVWLVKRERKVEFSDRFIPQPPKLTFEHDADKVWAELDWCGGSRGNIQLGANPQQAGNAAIKAIEDTIRNGGTASEALDAASKTDVTPFLNFDIGQSRSWRVSGKVEVTLNREGHRGTKGSAEIHVGPVHIKPNVTVDENGNPGGGIDARASATHRPPSPASTSRSSTRARRPSTAGRRGCPSTTGPWTPWSKQVPTDYYLYFEYAKKTVNKKLSGAPRAALLEEMRRGGRAPSITAHTSPEGSHEAQGKAWQGNTKLAEERAAAAEEWVRAVIAEAGHGSIETKAKVDDGRRGRALHAERRGGQGHRGPQPRAERGGDVRHLRRGGPAPPGGRRGAQEGPEERPRPRGGRLQAPAPGRHQGHAHRERRDAGREGPGQVARPPVPCNPVSDAEIAKRYPQFTFDR